MKKNLFIIIFILFVIFSSSTKAGQFSFNESNHILTGPGFTAKISSDFINCEEEQNSISFSKSEGIPKVSVFVKDAGVYVSDNKLLEILNDIIVDFDINSKIDKEYSPYKYENGFIKDCYLIEDGIRLLAELYIFVTNDYKHLVMFSLFALDGVSIVDDRQSFKDILETIALTNTPLPTPKPTNTPTPKPIPTRRPTSTPIPKSNNYSSSSSTSGSDYLSSLGELVGLLGGLSGESIRPEVAEAVDAYENCLDKLIDLLSGLTQNEIDIVKSGTDYVTLLVDLYRYEDEFDALDEIELNSAEEAYFFEAYLRIMGKYYKWLELAS